MLQVFLGNDIVKTRGGALGLLEKLRSQGGQINTIDEDNYETGVVTASVGNPSLFGIKNIYLIDEPLPGTTFYEEVVGNLAEMSESKDDFVIVLPALLAAEKKKFEKHADSFEEFKSLAKERFNNFSLADALAQKDKRSLWLLWNEARSTGAAAEELCGILWWQLKTLRLASLTKSAEEAGVKAFPYGKAKRALSKFTEGELDNLSQSLLSVIHDSRLGLSDLDQGVEHWILSI